MMRPNAERNYRPWRADRRAGVRRDEPFLEIDPFSPKDGKKSARVRIDDRLQRQLSSGICMTGEGLTRSFRRRR
jgi:hypothetical protein